MVSRTETIIGEASVISIHTTLHYKTIALPQIFNIHASECRITPRPSGEYGTLVTHDSLTRHI
jgi:hypothetical protein